MDTLNYSMHCSVSDLLQLQAFDAVLLSVG